MIDPYPLVKAVHILSATILFGTGLGTAAHMWLTHRSGSVQAIAVATRNTVRMDWVFTLSSGIVQPLSGAVLVWLGGHDPLSFWLVASYALYGVAGLCWVIVAGLQLRARALAAAAAERRAALPAEYQRIMRLWYMLGWPAFLGLIAVFGLMVAKPTL